MKISREIVERYRFIRALHTCYYTQLDVEVSEFATEFFFIVGDVLEGKKIDESKLRYVSLIRVREFLREDK